MLSKLWLDELKREQNNLKDYSDRHQTINEIQKTLHPEMKIRAILDTFDGEIVKKEEKQLKKK